MAKRKKRNTVTLISLFLALALLIGFYIWYSNRDVSPDEKKQVTNTIPVAALNIEEVDKLYLKNNAADITLVLEEEVWKSESEPTRPINQSYVRNMLNLIIKVDALRIVTDNPEDIKEYGLLNPAVYVKATQKDGKSLTLKIGNEVIGGGGYYALVDDHATVYILASSFGSGFIYTDTELTAVEEGLTINAEHIYHIKVINNNGDNFELKYDPENPLDHTTTNMFPWIILQPYEEGYLADGTKVSNILPGFSRFKFLTAVDYNSDDLSLYGLIEPSASVYVGYYEYYTMQLEEPEIDPLSGETVDTRTYYDEKGYTIYIGNMDEADNYYVRTENSNTVYTMRAAAVDTMLKVKPFDVLSSFISLVNIDAVDKINIQINNTPYTMEMKRKAVQDAEGKDTTEVTYYYNDAVTEEKTFKGVYQTMIAAGFDAIINGEINAEGIEPFMTITYHFLEDDTVVTTSYLPYNDSFYLVEREGYIRFFADKRKIDNIAKTIIDFKKNE